MPQLHRTLLCIGFGECLYVAYSRIAYTARMEKRRLLLTVHLPLLLTAIFWGSNFVAIKSVLGTLTVWDVAATRGVLAATCHLLTLVFLWRGRTRVRREDWRRLVGIGVLGSFLTPIPIVVAQQFITASVSSLLTTINPLSTAFFAWLLLGTVLTPRRIVGMGMGLAGFLVILLLGGPEVRFSTENAVGVLIMVCSPLAWGLYSVVSKPLLDRYPAMQLTAYSSLIGSVLLLPIFLTGTPARLAQLSPTGWLTILWIGVGTMWLAYVFWFMGLRALQPSQVAVYIYLVPCFGVFFGWLLLGERLTPFALLGGLAILAGVIVTNTASRAPQPRAALTNEPG